ncbi:hypothetical protein [Paenibacillus sp. L3-i20]|uniref:hypothetical protein n=1 Tax=Paenibacillus sp. L3-i20 TaxID=2905833 RepID=UPI0024A6FC6A|nr:hypothetical protein [Paenibacillus sp. L3-i20]
MEIVPSFAVGSAVGLRGFMSYIFGATLGRLGVGLVSDAFGWQGGFVFLLSGAVCCIVFCILTHYSVKEMYAKRALEQAQQ